MSMGEEMMAQVFDSFVSWAASQPDGAVVRADLEVIETALSGHAERSQTQACDAALRVAEAAARFEPESLLVWAFAALAEVWMLHDGGA